jgi:hypothetical protein
MCRNVNMFGKFLLEISGEGEKVVRKKLKTIL